MSNVESNLDEEAIDPDLPIVDPHHHMWFIPNPSATITGTAESLLSRALSSAYKLRPRYLFDELLSDLTSGHNIRATVFNDAHTMYRSTGPDAMKSVGEVEFVNGVAAMAASGMFGDVKVCAGIVGSVDLRIGDAAGDVLLAHIQAGGGRYRGVRAFVLYDSDSNILGPGVGSPKVLLDPEFRRGFQCLHRLGLSFDAMLLEPQLPDLVDLARSFPQTQIVLNHLGSPVGVGQYTGVRSERYSFWRKSMRTLAECDNVAVKLGGFVNPFGGFKYVMADPPATSAELAEEWRPAIDYCIDAFGPDRCMFESNFPIDASVGTYRRVWNAFKRVVAGASEDEKRWLFSETACRAYRIEI